MIYRVTVKRILARQLEMAEAAIAFVQVKEQESFIASVCSVSALPAALAYGTEVSPSAGHAGGALCANKYMPPRIAA